LHLSTRTVGATMPGAHTHRYTHAHAHSECTNELKKQSESF